MDIGTYTYMFIYLPYMCTYIHCDCQDHATMASIALAMTSALWEHTCIAINVLYNNCGVCVKCVCVSAKEGMSPSRGNAALHKKVRT